MLYIGKVLAVRLLVGVSLVAQTSSPNLLSNVTSTLSGHWVQIGLEGEKIITGPAVFSLQAGTGSLWSPIALIQSTSLPLFISWDNRPQVVGLGPDPAPGLVKNFGVIQTSVAQVFSIQAANAGATRSVTVPPLPVSQFTINDSAMIVSSHGTQSLTPNEVAALKFAASDPALVQLAADGIASAHGIAAGAAYSITWDFSAQITRVP